MADNSLSRTRCGFTLIELIVVVAIVLVASTLAAPAFSRLMEATRIRTEATRLMSDVVLARSEAIKRNRQVVMCPVKIQDDGRVACGGVFAGGWVLFEDSDHDGILGDGEEVIHARASMPPRLGVTNKAATRDAVQPIRLYPDGSSRRNLTLMVCSASHTDLASWSVVMNLVGRPRLARDWGDCEATGD